MRTRILLLAIATTAVSLAQQPDQIRPVIDALNKARAQHDGKAFAQLFDRDGSLSIEGRVTAVGPAAIASALNGRDEIWSETFSTGIQVQSIRFPSRNIAVVEGVQNRVGSLILKESVPVTVWLKRSRRTWRITSLQLAVPVSSTGQFPVF